MIRAVLDTNTLVSAVINTSFSVSQEIYQNFIDQHFLLILSPQILTELENVLCRERISKLHKLSSKMLQIILFELQSLSLIVGGTIEIKVVRDPDDNKIISAALEGSADYIDSRDKDLLDLEIYQGIKIITPERFMHLLRKQSGTS